MTTWILTIKLNGVYLNTLSKYVAGVVSDLRGKASADLHLAGSLSKPVFHRYGSPGESELPGGLPGGHDTISPTT
jgi:hypothetical protein